MIAQFFKLKIGNVSVNFNLLNKSVLKITYSAEPDVFKEEEASFSFFFGRPLFFGGLLAEFCMKCVKISVCFNRKSNRLPRSVSILLSNSVSFPPEDVDSADSFY